MGAQYPEKGCMKEYFVSNVRNVYVTVLPEAREAARAKKPEILKIFRFRIRTKNSNDVVLHFHWSNLVIDYEGVSDLKKLLGTTARPVRHFQISKHYTH